MGESGVNKAIMNTAGTHGVQAWWLGLGFEFSTSSCC